MRIYNWWVQKIYTLVYYSIIVQYGILFRPKMLRPFLKRLHWKCVVTLHLLPPMPYRAGKDSLGLIVETEG